MWRATLRDRSVWLRSLRIGLPVGALQIAVNQGDHWLTGHVTSAVVIKTIAAPAISIGIALVAATATVRSKSKHDAS
ncbi:MAG: hypothetical protein IAE82_13465 [Opitutaceae bacterium]|nr:hypothetical protein [Opitutaceae bacterium]